MESAVAGGLMEASLLKRKQYYSPLDPKMR